MPGTPKPQAHRVSPLPTAGGHVLSRCLVSLSAELGARELHWVVVSKGPQLETAYVALPQLQTSICTPFGVRKSKFHKKVRALPSRHIRWGAPLPLLATLKQLGAIPSKASKCQLVSMAAAAKLLSSFHGVPKTVVDMVVARMEAQQQPQQPQGPALPHQPTLLPSTLPPPPLRRRWMGC